MSASGTQESRYDLTLYNMLCLLQLKIARAHKHEEIDETLFGQYFCKLYKKLYELDVEKCSPPRYSYAVKDLAMHYGVFEQLAAKDKSETLPSGDWHLGAAMSPYTDYSEKQENNNPAMLQKFWIHSQHQLRTGRKSSFTTTANRDSSASPYRSRSVPRTAVVETANGSLLRSGKRPLKELRNLRKSARPAAMHKKRVLSSEPKTTEEAHRSLGCTAERNVDIKTAAKRSRDELEPITSLNQSEAESQDLEAAGREDPASSTRLNQLRTLMKKSRLRTRSKKKPSSTLERIYHSTRKVSFFGFSQHSQSVFTEEGNQKKKQGSLEVQVTVDPNKPLNLCFMQCFFG